MLLNLAVWYNTYPQLSIVFWGVRMHGSIVLHIKRENANERARPEMG